MAADGTEYGSTPDWTEDEHDELKAFRGDGSRQLVALTLTFPLHTPPLWGRIALMAVMQPHPITRPDPTTAPTTTPSAL